MNRIAAFALALAAALLAPAASTASPSAPMGSRTVAAQGVSGPAVVDVVKVHGLIDPPLDGYVRRTLERSQAEGATVVLQVDSLGGYGERPLELAAFIRGLRVPVIAWVGPSGARAAGAALFPVYASSLVAVAPGAGIGPATPFGLDPGESREAPSRTAALGKRLAALAADTDVPPTAIERLVDGRVMPAGPAIEAGAAAVLAANVPDLLTRVDGRRVRTAAGEQELRTRSRPGRRVRVRFHDVGLVARVAHAVTTPTAVYVLLLVGLWGIAFELTQPGIGLAGIGGAASLALAVYGLTVVPTSWWGLGLLLLGTAAQGLDVVIRRLGPLTFGGTAAFLAGSLLAWWRVPETIDLSLWLVVLATVAGFLLFGFGMTVALKARERVRAAQVGLVGLLGEVRSDLNPEGGVYVKGAMWRARSMDGRIPAGRRVRVRGVDGLVLRVEEEPPG